MSRTALLLCLLAGPLAALCVAGQRTGLALTVLLLLALGAAVAQAHGVRSRAALALGIGLAIQPTLRDAGWVVAGSVVLTCVAGAAAVVPTGSWSALARAALAPLRVDRAGGALARALTARTRGRVSVGRLTAVTRGAALAVLLTACFGALFASADSAFAEQAGDLVSITADPVELTWRAVLGMIAVLGSAALAAAALPRPIGPSPARWAPGATELRIALGALVALFAAFVLVQLQVLFGGADYVQRTTGLGLGEYARQGFVQLLVVAALTLAVVAIAARRRDRVVRLLLGALCALTLVVLVAALERIALVEDAYGLTRVRYGGHAIALWLAGVFVVVLAAGASRRVARWAPQATLLLTLAGALAFCVSDPDRRIAESAVARYERSGTLDEAFLRTLSADALPALRRLQGPTSAPVLEPVEARLQRPDGLLGFNVARRIAR